MECILTTHYMSQNELNAGKSAYQSPRVSAVCWKTETGILLSSSLNEDAAVDPLTIDGAFDWGWIL